jgi:hypothetical protein
MSAATPELPANLPATKASPAMAPMRSAAVGANAVGVHLVFVPEWQAPYFFLWGSESSDSSLAVLGDPSSTLLVDEALQVQQVVGYSLPLLPA